MLRNEDRILATLSKLDSILSKNESFGKQKGDDMPFLDTLAHWLNGRQARISPNTYNGYKSCIDAHIRPFFTREKPLMLTGVTYELVQEFAGLLVSQKKSPKTIRKIIKEVLQQFFTVMVKAGNIDRTPVTLVEIPKLNHKPKDAYTADELAKLLKVIPKEHPWRISVYLLAFTGIRRGELLGLTWDNVHLDEGYIFICKTNVATRGEKTCIKETTKTRAGRRSIPISPNVVKALKYHKNHIQKGSCNLVIEGMTALGKGKPVDGNNFKRTWKRWTEKAGIRYLGIHAVRHFYVTESLNCGASMSDTQKLMGWADMRMFMTYEDPKQRANAVRNTAEMISTGLTEQLGAF